MQLIVAVDKFATQEKCAQLPSHLKELAQLQVSQHSWKKYEKKMSTPLGVLQRPRIDRVVPLV